MKLVIIGGVAGGAAAAARARRLDETAEITIIEKGPYVSFANCGLPYHIGGIIEQREALLVQTPQSLSDRFNINVLTEHEAMSLERDKQTVVVHDTKAGKDKILPYDKLILSTGAEPFRPPIPGINSPGIFSLWTMMDMDAILSWIQTHQAKHATVVGAGFIGLEAAENFKHRGLEVAVIEKLPQALPPIDPEMAELIHQNLRTHSIDLRLGTTATQFTPKDSHLVVSLDPADKLVTDLIIISIGARPRTSLAKEAGLTIGVRGGIEVSDTMQSSDPNIYAIGDVVQINHAVMNIPTLMPLAGPANKQARVAVDNILGRKNTYRGTIGTAVCQVFDQTVAFTGASEKALKMCGQPYNKVMTHSANHAGYYPGACPIALKTLFHPEDGKILGAVAVGTEGVDKRIDVMATAISGGLSVFDLEHLELCYAPPYGSAKDPVNMAGHVAANILRGDHIGIQVEELESLVSEDYIVLDVCNPEECEQGTIPGAQMIPLNQLRAQLDQIPKGKPIITCCKIGLRGYIAQRILSQHGFECKNLIGGYSTWLMNHPNK